MDDGSKTEATPSGGKVGMRRFRKHALISLFVLLAHVLGALTSIHAIMATRTAQGAIGWAISLNTLPYVSVPAYWVLGRSKFNGYVEARQVHEQALRKEDPDLFADDRYRDFVAGNVDPISASGYNVLTRLAGRPFTRANEVELLVDGEATFASIFAGIERARQYVLVQFYIVRDDRIGRDFQKLLIAKAREGVKVLLLYDEVGCIKLPKPYVQELRAAGVQVTPFDTTQGPRNRFQINFRNHRKIVIVDGREAWIGGHNVGDEYMGRDPKFGPWRDTHVRIEGPAAIEVQHSFAEDWHWATGKIPEVTWTPVASRRSDQDVIVIPSSPADVRETATLAFLQAIMGARERLWIASPYFVPDRDLLCALELAALRGVDVRILIPDNPDHLLVYLSAFTFVDELRATNIRFFRYQEGFLHEKVVLVDNRVAVVGTANFDNRSMRLNFEISAVVADPEFAGQVEAMLEKDFARSRAMDAGEYRARPFWFRLAARVARLMAPVQ
jgi:cardiolipin synthase A/B